MTDLDSVITLIVITLMVLTLINFPEGLKRIPSAQMGSGRHRHFFLDLNQI